MEILACVLLVAYAVASVVLVLGATVAAITGRIRGGGYIYFALFGLGGALSMGSGRMLAVVLGSGAEVAGEAQRLLGSLRVLSIIVALAFCVEVAMTRMGRFGRP